MGILHWQESLYVYRELDPVDGLHCIRKQHVYGDYIPGDHLFPFRTEQLSPGEPMVLRNSGRVGRRRFFYKSPSHNDGLFIFTPESFLPILLCFSLFALFSL